MAELLAAGFTLGTVSAVLVLVVVAALHSTYLTTTSSATPVDERSA